MHLRSRAITLGATWQRRHQHTHGERANVQGTSLWRRYPSAPVPQKANARCNSLNCRSYGMNTTPLESLTPLHSVRHATTLQSGPSAKSRCVAETCSGCRGRLWAAALFEFCLRGQTFVALHLLRRPVHKALYAEAPLGARAVHFSNHFSCKINRARAETPPPPSGQPVGC